MNHFYRMMTQHNCLADEALILRMPDRYKNDRLGLAKFRIGTERNEIALNPPWPHCRMYRGPLYDSVYELDIVVDLRGHDSIPDVVSRSDFIIVSEKAKKIVENFDDFGHQFYETRILNERGEKVNQSPYFIMTVRRVLDIEKLDLPVDERTLSFPWAETEMKFLSTVLHYPALKARIADIPFWRQHENSDTWYLSEDMLQAMRDAGITGLNSYSSQYSFQSWQSISIV